MEFRPLHPEFGVEVLGFDIAADPTGEEIACLQEAYDRHSMLLFRGQDRLSHERHHAFAARFGPPSPLDNFGDGTTVTELRNADPAGSVVLPFHSDQTYTDDPIAAICLQAIELPERPTSTTYVSGAAAWDALPAELRARLDGLTLRHVLEASATGMDWPRFVADHPLRFDHPRTGRPILFATEHHATRILELEDAQSRALIDELFAHLYAPQRKYEHVWQLNDVLMWDNLVLQHARTEQSDPGQGVRALQRVALCDLTLDEAIAIAREREAA